MIRKLSALLLALLLTLTAIPALAETVPAAFRGSWTVLYCISGDNVVTPAVKDFIITDQGLLLSGSHAEPQPCTAVSGDIATFVSGATATILPPDMLLIELPGEYTVIVRRTGDAPSVNPFLGNWRILLASSPNATEDYADMGIEPYMVFSETDVLLKQGNTTSAQFLASYNGDVCTMTGRGNASFTVTIDSNGLMHIDCGDDDIHYLLVRYD